MIFKDVREEMFIEIAKSIDSCSSYLGCTMVKTFGNEDIHDWILKIFLYFLCATFTNSSKNQEACIHFIHIVRVNESNGCFEENRVDFFRFNSDSQGLDQPKGNFLYKLSNFSIVIFLMMIRFTAGKTNSLHNFFEQGIS